jgi:putative transport protein
MDPIIKALQTHPELAIFLALALGYLIGRIKLGSFAVGSVTGVLIGGVLVGQI